MPSASPCAIVIFGASGDLAKRKLIPAVYEMAREKLLPEKFVLVGYARSEMSDEQYRAECADAVSKFARTKPVDMEIWKRIEPNIFYVQGDYGPTQQEQEVFTALSAELDQVLGALKKSLDVDLRAFNEKLKGAGLPEVSAAPVRAASNPE